MNTRSVLYLDRAPVLCLVCILALTGCSSAKPVPPSAPPEVGVVTLHAQPVTITTDLPGRTVAYRIAEVRPQVSGVILKRLFTEGSEVKAGQQLYQIDPAPFQAKLESARASLAHAQATLTSARLLAQRYQPLAEAHAVSQQAYDNAAAAEDQAIADVASAKAAVDAARINLAYTRVLSPISGRTGRPRHAGQTDCGRPRTGRGNQRQLPAVGYGLPWRRPELSQRTRFAMFTLCGPADADWGEAGTTAESGDTVQGAGWRLERARRAEYQCARRCPRKTVASRHSVIRRRDSFRMVDVSSGS